GDPRSRPGSPPAPGRAGARARPAGGPTSDHPGTRRARRIACGPSFARGASGRPATGAAHPAAPLGGALLLVQPAPGAVLLRARDGVVQALGAHRAGRADLLGP